MNITKKAKIILLLSIIIVITSCTTTKSNESNHKLEIKTNSETKNPEVKKNPELEKMKLEEKRILEERKVLEEDKKRADSKNKDISTTENEIIKDGITKEESDRLKEEALKKFEEKENTSSILKKKKDEENPEILTLKSKEAEITKSKTIKITAVGDMMLGTTYPDIKYLSKNPENLLKPAIPFLKKGDVIFGNLEGPLTDKAPLHKRCKNPRSCYAFKSPTKYIKYYKEAGFNFLSMGNNHSGDFGLEGRDETRSTLNSANIVYSGIIGDVAIKTINGHIIGMIAFAPNWGCNNLNNISMAKKLVKELDKKVDIIMVSFHGGAEGRKATHVYKEGTEMFLGEKRGDLLKFTKAVIDAGADIVIGQGPHVPRAMDIYKKRLIMFSLGNFVTYGRFSLRGISGYAPLVLAEINAKGEFLNGNIFSLKQIGKGGVVVDKKNRAAKLIKKLTEEDFPKSKLSISISNSGKLTIKK